MPSSSAAYPGPPSAGTARLSRTDAAAHLHVYDGARDQGSSQRAAADQAGVARGTARCWNDRRRDLGLPPAVGAFVETPEGQLWLRQTVMAAVFVMTLRGPTGIRMICEYLELAGLAEVVGASFGSIQKLTREMQQEVVAFGQEQQATLARGMPQKSITLCEDETFHPKTCLVAIEPASNFIVLERYVVRRDAEIWNQEVTRALAGLDVKLMQSTSDQGQALLRHARDAGAHHSPDLFHPQQDLVWATARPLTLRLRRASERYDKAAGQLQQVVAQEQAYRNKRHGPGRPPDFAGRIEHARQAVEEADRAVAKAFNDREVCRDAIAGLSVDYHCYRLADGGAQSAEQTQALLQARFAVIDEVAARVKLSKKCLKRIDKARRVTADMVDTIRFVHVEIGVRLTGLSISSALRAEVAARLVPGLYLQRVAARATLAKERSAINAVADKMLTPLRAPDHLLQQLDAVLAERVRAVAAHCADVFQRSSSCVEGRNGQLALFHHGLHRLTETKLAAPTVIHNFHIRRPDGTSPADRFFETRHDDLFTRLLDRMPQLARPAKPRSLRPYRAAMRAAA